MYHSSMIHDSLPGGNNNERLDPGETGNIVVTLASAGLEPAQGVTAELRSGDPLFVITQGSSVNPGALRDVQSGVPRKCQLYLPPMASAVWHTTR